MPKYILQIERVTTETAEIEVEGPEAPDDSTPWSKIISDRVAELHAIGAEPDWEVEDQEFDLVAEPEPAGTDTSQDTDHA